MSGKLLYYVALSILRNSYLRKIYPLINEYSAEDIFYFLKPDFHESINGFIAKTYKGDVLTAASNIIGACQKAGFGIVPITDEKYPRLLKEIYDPPPVIYTKGISGLVSPVAIVGTRNADSRSADFTSKISKELSSAGCEIISGMAKGIDRYAHAGVLDAGGKTVGVLANGIDSWYPSENNDIFRKIENSADSFLISEYPPGVTADRWTFVRRNRIISGIACASVIVKASVKSGALITAKYAIEQNREIFVCPGNVFDPEYAGCNNLIKQGASIFTTTEDLLESISSFVSKTRKPDETKKTVNDEELAGIQTDENIKISYDPESMEYKIIDSVRKKIHLIDDIALNLQIDSGILNRKIVEMELEGNIALEGSKIVLTGVK